MVSLTGRGTSMRRIKKRLLALGLAFWLASPALAQTGPGTTRLPNAQPTNGPYGGFNAVRPGNPVGTTATGTPSGPYGGQNAVRLRNPKLAPSGATTAPTTQPLTSTQFNQFFSGLNAPVLVSPIPGTTTVQPTSNPPATGPYGGFNAVSPGNPGVTQPGAVAPGGTTATGTPSGPYGGQNAIRPGNPTAVPSGATGAPANEPLISNADFNRLFGGLNPTLPLIPTPAQPGAAGVAFPGAAAVPGFTTPGAQQITNPFLGARTAPGGPAVPLPSTGVPNPGTSVTNPATTPGTGTGVSGYNSNSPGVLPNSGSGVGNVPGGTGTPAPANPPQSIPPSQGNVPR
jgi:hypothetical protein